MKNDRNNNIYANGKAGKNGQKAKWKYSCEDVFILKYKRFERTETITSFAIQCHFFFLHVFCCVDCAFSLYDILTKHHCHTFAANVADSHVKKKTSFGTAYDTNYRRYSPCQTDLKCILQYGNVSVLSFVSVFLSHLLVEELCHIQCKLKRSHFLFFCCKKNVQQMEKSEVIT